MITRKDQIEEITCEIRTGKHRHIGLFVGSAVSVGGQSYCASVREIMRELVLRPLLNAEAETSEISRLIESLLSMEPKKDDLGGLRSALQSLPFEQFMSCLFAADKDTAGDIIKIACGPEKHAKPNGNHLAITSLAARVLKEGLAEKISILTTNYDLCIEAALKNQGVTLRVSPEWQESSQASRSIRVSEAIADPGHMLELIKFHGCVSEPSSMVYTFGQMAPLLLESQLVHSVVRFVTRQPYGPISLLIFIGYSFSDPDIRPVLELGLLHEDCMIYWNEREEKARTIAAPAMNLSGHEMLRDEFFTGLGRRQIKFRMHYSDLCSESSLPIKLASDFSGETQIKAPPSINDPLSLRKSASDIMTRFRQRDGGRSQVVRFLAELADCCSCSDAVEILWEDLGKPQPLGRSPLVRLYLEQFFHAHQIPESIGASRWIRKRFRDKRCQIVCYAYESLAHQLMGSWFGALIPLIRGRALLKHVHESERVLFLHMEDHYLAKVSVKCASAGGALPDRLRSTWSYLWRVAASRTRTKCITTMMLAKKLGSVRFYADQEELVAQLEIISGCESARKRAEVSRALRAAIGQPNGVCLSDRVLGWTFLSEGDRTEAIRTFAQGLMRATFSEDNSIKLKLAANLARVLVAVCDIDKQSLEQCEAPDLNRVREACKVLSSEEFQASWLTEVGGGQSEVIETLIAYYVSFYGVRTDLVMRDLRRYGDISSSPMFLPSRPPDRDPT